METSVDNLRLILGLKLKNLRQERGASLKDVAGRAGVSVSYLSEIEKGKKYPKTEKLIDLARALDVSFDELVSQRVDDSLVAIKQAIASPFVQEFPFALFGVETQDLVSLMASMPDKAGALIRTFAEVSRNYDARVEHFLFAALRSYQQLHGNHFPALEEQAAAYRDARGWEDGPIVAATLRAVLEEDYGYTIDTETLPDHPDLSGFRSVFVEDAGGGGPRLFINGNLLPSQQAFIYAREIGFEVLGVEDRPETSSWLKVTSFEQVLGNFEASYFAGALLISRAALDRDLRAFFRRPRWDEAAFLSAFDRYHATPEMFFYRLSQLIPADFGLREIYFMRFNNPRGTDRYGLTKVLNMSDVPVPHGLRRGEHFCRRWPSIAALQALDARQTSESDGPVVRVQRSHFLNDDATFFEIAIARPLALTGGTNTAISMGFLADERFKRAVRFWEDPAIPTVDVNLTCERCPLPPDACHVRAAPPTVLEEEAQQARRETALAELGVTLG